MILGFVLLYCLYHVHLPIQIFWLFSPVLFIPYVILPKFSWPETMLLDIVLYYRFNTSCIHLAIKKRKDIEFNIYLIFLFIRTGKVMTNQEINDTLESIKKEDPNIYYLICVLGYENIKRKDKSDCINAKSHSDHKDHVNSMLDVVLRKKEEDIDEDDMSVLWCADAMSKDDKNRYKKKWIAVSKRPVKLWKHLYNSRTALAGVCILTADAFRTMDISEYHREKCGLSSLVNEGDSNKLFVL